MIGANQATLGNKAVQRFLILNIIKLFKMISENKHTVMVHWAAGIHRTGTISYILQRMFGFRREQAYENLKLMREQTHKGVGEWRIEIAEKVYDKILKKLSKSKEKIEEEK